MGEVHAVHGADKSGREEDGGEDGEDLDDLVLLHVQDAHGGLLQVAHFVMFEGEVVFDPGNVRGQFVDPGLQFGLGEAVDLGVEVADNARELQHALAALRDEVFVAREFGQEFADLGHGAGLAGAQFGRHFGNIFRELFEVGADGLNPVGHRFTQGEEQAPEDFLRIVVEMGPAADALGEDGHGHELDLVQGDHAVLVEDEGQLVDPGGVFLVFAYQAHSHEERVVLMVNGRVLEGEFDA